MPAMPARKGRGKLKPATATAATAAAAAVATAVAVATAIAVSAATLFLRAAAAGGCRIEWVAAAGAWRKSQDLGCSTGQLWGLYSEFR